MAAPGLAGTLAQLIQAFRDNNSNQDPKTGLLMGIVLNTAEDLGVAGPDFIYGFGKISATRAVKVIQNKTYFSNTVTTGQTRTHTINVPANTKQLKVMTYWTDPAATSGTTKALINDLDMIVKKGGTNFLPLVLNPSKTDVNALNAPAIPGVDRLNNKEQVVIDNPSGTYTIDITGFAVPTGPQEYFLVYEFSQDEITINSPVNNGSLIQGATALITWDAIGNSGTFNIQYSLNDGASWVTINSALAGNRRSITWAVPNTTTGKAKIRISRNGIIGETVNNFAILPRPTGLAVEFKCSNFSKVTWTALTGVDGYVIYNHDGFQLVPVGESSTNSFNLQSPSSENVYFAVAAKKDGLSGYRSAALLKTSGTTQNCNDCVPVTASAAQTGNEASNVLDNNLNTRWSAEGIGQTLTFCLANPTLINSVEIAFHLGDSRTSLLDIQSSNDGVTFTNLSTNISSSGTTLNKELFMFTPSTAKYFRIVAKGNSSNNWNSYNEVEFKFTQPLVNQNLSISNLTRTNATPCGNVISLNATVQNLGEQTANGYWVDVFQNNVLTNTIDFTTTLAKNQSDNIQISDINVVDFGSFNLKAEVRFKNNITDEEISNNTQTINVAINEGTEHYFYITSTSLNNNISVNILNDNNENIQTITANNLVTQGNLKIAKFCLPNDCYNITVSNAFSSGSCNYPDWSASTIYTGDAARGSGNGEVVKFNGRIYRAQWWTQNNEPGTDNVWLDLGVCNTSDPNAVYGLKKVENDSLYFENALANFSQQAVHNFCIQTNTVIDFIANNLTVEHCEEITFSTNNTGNQINWEFGEDASPLNASGTGPHTVKYLKPGLKTVSLTIDGNVTSKSNYITVTANNNYNLQVNALSNGITFCEGENVSLNAEVTPQTNGVWFWKNNTQRFNGSSYNFNATEGVQSFSAVFYPDNECVLVDSIVSENIDITTQKNVNASISIQSNTTFPTCSWENDFIFNSNIENGRTSPIISWFKNNELQIEGTDWNAINLSQNDSVFATMQSNALCLINDVANSNVIYIQYYDSISQTNTIPLQELAAGFDTYTINLANYILNPSNLNLSYQISSPSQIVNTNLQNSILEIVYNELFGEDEVKITVTDECNTGKELVINFVVDGNGLNAVNVNGIHAQIFPNPFHELITVTSNSKEQLFLEITDINGKIVSVYTINSEVKTLTLPHLNAGVYFAKLYNAKFNQSFKLIKQH